MRVHTCARTRAHTHTYTHTHTHTHEHAYKFTYGVWDLRLPAGNCTQLQLQQVMHALLGALECTSGRNTFTPRTTSSSGSMGFPDSAPPHLQASHSLPAAAPLPPTRPESNGGTRSGNKHGNPGTLGRRMSGPCQRAASPRSGHRSTPVSDAGPMRSGVNVAQGGKLPVLASARRLQ